MQQHGSPDKAGQPGGSRRRGATRRVNRTAATLVLEAARQLQCNCSFNALLTALDTRYGIAAPEFVTKARLRDIFQQEGQSLRAYADLLTKHVGIKPGSESVEERIVLEQFLHGILDVKVRRYVNKRNPVSIDDAIRLGRECEEVRDWMSESVDQTGVNKIHDLESEVASLKQEVLRLSGAPRMRSEDHHDSDTIAVQRMRPRVPRLIDKDSTASCAPTSSSATCDLLCQCSRTVPARPSHCDCVDAPQA